LIALFDTETTSLIGNSLKRLEMQPRVIEFYGCILDNSGVVMEELEFLCHPGIEIPEEVTKITGITKEEVQGLPPFKEHFEKVRWFFSRADTVVAHNLHYDLSVMDFEAKRLQDFVPWPKTLICTVEATEHLKGYRLSLTALHELLFGEAFEGAHRAKGDVQALVKCFLKLKEQGEI
jgi:DNA polymerase III epsilon subunit-like protein